MDEGYIKLFRSLQNWEWYLDSNTKDVFIHLLINANWEDYRFMGYEVPRGSMVTSYSSLSRDLRLSIKSVRTAIKHLKQTGEVTVKVTNKFSIITIVNWDKFQGGYEKKGKQSDKQNGRQRAGNGQATGNNIRNKEIKNIRREEEIEPSFNPEEVQNLFNTICIFFKPCSTITKTRLEKIKLLRQQFDLEEIEEVFNKANQSDFLKGKNDRAWKASFDWLIDIDNFVKVKEDAFCNSIHLVEKKENNLKQYSDYNDLDQMERETREKARNPYHNYIHGNYDFEQMERELKEK